MGKYSKDYIKEQLKSFTPKELQAFKRLVQEFHYPVDRAFEKIIKLRERHNSLEQSEPKEPTNQTPPNQNKQQKKEEIVKNEGGQNIIKPVSSEEFELIGFRDEIEPEPYKKRAKDFSEDEIIPFLDPREKELDALSPKQRKIYDSFISMGRTHEDAIKEAYQEAKKELSQKLEKLEAFYGIGDE